MNKQSQYSQRIKDLKDARSEVFGMGHNIEKIWQQADHDYVPHTIQKGGKKTLVARDETAGWASRYVDLGGDNWQTANASVNPYIKIQTALSIMIARNPSVELSAGAKKYENSTLLQKELHKKSWEIAKSLQQVKLFAFNLSKYGWAAMRTYPYQNKNKNKVAQNYDPDNFYFGKRTYETKEASEFNGVFREALDPWMVWIDDKTRPNMPLSTRDWVYGKWIPYNLLEKEFGKSPNWKYIQKGNSGALDEENSNYTPKFVTKDMKFVHFYENLDDDVFTVECDDVPLLEIPLPIADLSGRKYLTLSHTYWTLRHVNSPMGIGINEAIKGDKNLYDKMRNMTVDQIILSIYKMFFYQGTDQMDSDGIIKIRPGIGKQVAEPQNMKWLDTPGPGKDAYNGIEMQQNAIDEASAVTKPLTGQEMGKTAYEAAQASEFSLRRLQTPLGNITDALEQDAELTMVINRMIYSIPEVIKITNPELVRAYYEEIKGDPDLYERDEQDNFFAKLYPEIQMNLDTDEGGRLIESEDQKFFRMRPKGLDWEGTISVKGQSILIETKVLQKAQTLELFNIITPLLAQPKDIVMKPIKQLCKKYDVDWKEWIPDFWIMEQPQQEESGNILISAEQVAKRGNMANQTILPKNEVGTSNKSLISQTSGQLGKLGTAVGR
jgi:hypothetical protein